jgi:uncharacterized membrane protein YfcA
MLILVETAVLGAAVGTALGMLGGGGSILTVPILVYVLHLSPHIAIAASLLIVGSNALIGAAMHYRDGHVKLRPALTFGSLGIAAAFIGARASKLVSGPVLLTLFALLMLIIAVLMLAQRRERAKPSAHGAAAWWRIALGGVSVGFLTGFLGVGGGFLVVPALVFLLGMEMRDAVGSSLVVIALNSAAGVAGHLNDGAFPWGLILFFVLAGVAGLLAGLQITQRISAARLRQAFAGFVIALGLTLLAINLPLALAALHLG